MKIIALLALVALTVGCHSSPSEKRADQRVADARANVLDNYSNLLDAQAKEKQNNRQTPLETGDTGEDNIAGSLN
jgi:hypothetical protein